MIIYIMIDNTYYIHYIFLDIGLGKLEDKQDYLDNIKHNSELYPDYKIWRDMDILGLIDNHYPDLKDRILNMPYTYLVDFARPLILNLYGGFYCDMDVRINKKIPEDKEIIHSLYTYPTTKRTILGNSLFKLPQEKYYPFIIYCLDQYDEKDTIPIYEKWKYRKLLHTVGGYALKRFGKIHNLKFDFPFYEFCRESNTAQVLVSITNGKQKGLGGMIPLNSIDESM